MSRSIAAVGLSLACGLACSAVSASTVSISPGGSVTMTGMAAFQTQDSSGVDYAGSCSLTLTTSFNPSTASFSVTNAVFGYPCGYYGSDAVWADYNTLPWTGTTKALTTSVWQSTIPNMDVFFVETEGFGPYWAADCQNSVPLAIDWFTTGGVASAVTTSGYRQFATTPNGRKCYVSFTLNLSPSQTLTTHP